MVQSREASLEKAAGVPAQPVAVEAYWDGDSDGWFVVLAMLYVEQTAGGPRHREFNLGALRGASGDLRLFNNQVPPWPEAERAREAGEEVAARFSVPFFFPSSDHPEESCPRWWERDQGSPCRRCGIPLLQDDSCPWRGACYNCHLKEEREKREAEWSPEERASPRCEICGNPAKGWSGTTARCQACLDRYEEYQCSRCGVRVLVLKADDHTDLCTRCNRLAAIDSMTEEQREAIRRFAKTGNKIGAIKEVRNILVSVHLGDAKFIAEILADSSSA